MSRPTLTVPRKLLGLAASATLVTSLAACGGGADASGDTITLSYASWATPELSHSQAAEDWMAAVTERTDGRVEFQTDYNGAICKVDEMVSCIQDGRVDIGFASAVFTPAEMPASQLGSVPFQTPNNQASALALNEMYEENDAFRAEWENTNQHLLFHSPAALPMLGLDQEIESVDDLEGLSVRTVGFNVNPMKELGVNPVAMAPEEQYESIERGVLNGALYEAGGFVDSRLFEVLDHMYDIGAYMGSYAMVYNAMNSDVWDGLPADVRRIMTEESAKIAPTIDVDYNEPELVKSCEVYAEEMDGFSALEPAAELEAWAAEMKERAVGEWLGVAEKAGLDDAQAIIDDYHARLAAHEDTAEARPAGEICAEAFAS